MEIEFCICPSCLSYSPDALKCLYCSYMVHEFPYDQAEMTPYFQYIRLFNNKMYAEAHEFLKSRLDQEYDDQLYKALVNLECQLSNVPSVLNKDPKIYKTDG